MRIIVFSDSHGNTSNMEAALDCQTEARYVIHLGDGVEQLEDISMFYPSKQFIYLSGNNDWSSNHPYERLTEIGGIRIFMAHGHTQYVGYSTQRLLDTAKKCGAKIALYGHTHVAEVSYRDGIYIMNPGSIAQPRQGRKSYGYIDITPQGIFCSTIEL